MRLRQPLHADPRIGTWMRLLGLRLSLVLAGLSIGLAMLPPASQAQAPAPAKPSATAQPASSTGPAWNELPPAQQAALAPLKPQWAGIAAERKAKWIAVAQRFPQLPAADRERLQARMAEWAVMAPAERGTARRNFQELRHLPAQDRQALWEAYQSLPDEQRRELADRAKRPVRSAEPASPPRSGEARRAVPVNPPPVPARPVTPTIEQARPGATTRLVTKPPTPPAHTQQGLPKITATDEFVDRSTLLPSRGPQGAATVRTPPAAASAAAAGASGASGTAGGQARRR